MARERWDLWEWRLRDLEGEVEGETKEVVREARGVVEGLLAAEEGVRDGLF